MTTAPTNTIPANRRINNLADTGRKIPSTALAPLLLKAQEGTRLEILAGTNNTAIDLLEKVAPNTTVLALAFVTASGAGAARTLLRQATDFDVIPEGPNGVGQILPAGDESANTLVILYSPDRPEGTVGGQSDLQITDLGTLQP